MIVILVLNILAVFLLISACAATVRFFYRTEPVIIIYFLLFEIRLFPTRNREKTKKAQSRADKKVKGAFKSAVATKKALDFLFKHSDVTVHTLSIRAQETDPAKETVYNGYISTLICAMLAYLRKKSLNLKSYTQPFDFPEESTPDSPTIDITLFTSLHVIAFSLLIFSKDKRKRERKIVRN
jgi:hypothetical protein